MNRYSGLVIVSYGAMRFSQKMASQKLKLAQNILSGGKMVPTHAQYIIHVNILPVAQVTIIIMILSMRAPSYLSKFLALGHAHLMCFLFSSYSYPALIEIRLQSKKRKKRNKMAPDSKNQMLFMSSFSPYLQKVSI